MKSEFMKDTSDNRVSGVRTVTSASTMSLDFETPASPHRDSDCLCHQSARNEKGHRQEPKWVSIYSRVYKKLHSGCLPKVKREAKFIMVLFLSRAETLGRNIVFHVKSVSNTEDQVEGSL